jgi:hypothetical protein
MADTGEDITRNPHWVFPAFAPDDPADEIDDYLYHVAGGSPFNPQNIEDVHDPAMCVT